MNTQAQFNIGQVIEHKLYGYRGVIVDVDPQFMQTDDWYQLMVKGNPSKNVPWYYILVDGTPYKTYVAQEYLTAAEDDAVVNHDEIQQVNDTLNQPQH